MGEPDTKATRRAARDRVAVYHQEQLRGCSGTCAMASRGMTRGSSTRSSSTMSSTNTPGRRELWKFCELTGSRALYATGTLDYWAREGEEPDWWELGAPRRRR
jgi:hypothetical protein